MLYTQANIFRKLNNIKEAKDLNSQNLGERRKCLIEKIIVVDVEKYKEFSENLLRDSDIVSQYKDLQYVDEDGNSHCIFVKSEDGNDGILVECEGYNYARYTGYIENISQLQEMQEVKFYSTLDFRIFDKDIYKYDPYFDSENMQPSEALKYKDEIIKAVENTYTYFENEHGLMNYYNQYNYDLMTKVYSAYPTIEEFDGKLYGVMEMQIKGELTDLEIDIMKNEWTNQYSYGWGETFEQQPIKLDCGYLYVNFGVGNNYFIKTNEEFFVQDQSMNLSM